MAEGGGCVVVTERGAELIVAADLLRPPSAGSAAFAVAVHRPIQEHVVADAGENEGGRGHNRRAVPAPAAIVEHFEVAFLQAEALDHLAGCRRVGVLVVVGEYAVDLFR